MVLAQDPAAGAQVRPGTVVVVTVSARRIIPPIERPGGGIILPR
jgi:hypothetical protein